MGKKDKGKKKSSGKKKKGGKKKKNAEPEMTWEEALLAYKINVQERYLEDYKYELRALEDQNMRHKERNERLENEQNAYMAMLLKQAREYEKEMAEEKVVQKKEVVEVMFENWQAERDEEKDIVVFKEKIAHMQTDIDNECKTLEYWQDYRDSGQHKHSKQIELLKQELVDMQKNYDEITGHLTRSLNKAKTEIEQNTEDTLDKQKGLASDKAMAKMDKHSAQEVVDNKWLKRETQIHFTEVDKELRIVEELERECLAIMSELFECTVEDLKISRNVFLTQFSDKENLDETGILEIDLAQVALYDEKTKTHRPTKLDEINKKIGEEMPPRRPKSATQQYIEDKVFGLNKVVTSQKDVILEEDESDTDGHDSDYDNEQDAKDSDDPFNNYYTFDDEDFEDYLQLGPIELKLLNIEGKHMDILRAKTPTAEEMQARLFQPEYWPVTARMIPTSIGGDG